jgi:hypothetical protein
LGLGRQRLPVVLTGGRMERSLYERANGYSYDAVKIFMPENAKKPVVAVTFRRSERASPLSCECHHVRPHRIRATSARGSGCVVVEDVSKSILARNQKIFGKSFS